ncbi:hypothetical protein OUZ56_010532 [Daphnia magna]|uniref:Uncharacterized protein n=1 Tax=Daphnia magna TaxID=35525 RepID=A0ABR0AIT7_9CRUS|nr:hypothetical protein OUZ56_010532 [Daphnia magna]
MSTFDKYKTQKSFRPSNDGSHRAPNIQTVPAFANVIKQARKLVSKINTSSVATPNLIALSVSADKNATFSSAFLCIEELKLHLEKCSGITGLNGVATAMLEDLKRRFNFMSDERDPDFDGSYLLATCLDCNHRIHVIEDLNIQSLVVKHVVNIAKQMGLPYSATPTPGTEPPIFQLLAILLKH